MFGTFSDKLFQIIRIFFKHLKHCIDEIHLSSMIQNLESFINAAAGRKRREMWWKSGKHLNIRIGSASIELSVCVVYRQYWLTNWNQVAYRPVRPNIVALYWLLRVVQLLLIRTVVWVAVAFSTLIIFHLRTVTACNMARHAPQPLALLFQMNTHHQLECQIYCSLLDSATARAMSIAALVEKLCRN